MRESAEPTGRVASLAYQPALDGLRGLAVAAVFLYHADVASVPGGFLGVDTFFVLSGYLITTLLVLEFRRDGRIALGAFWARRARRLLPALLLLLVGVAAYSAFVAARSELRGIRADAFATLGYVENWRLVFAQQSYFEQFNAPSPLRHAWSLAIEEQFYLVWPVLFGALLWWSRGKVARLVVPLLAMLVVSVGLSFVLYAPGRDPSRVYYGTDTRAQALLVGALLAVVLARIGPFTGAVVKRAVEVGGVCGLAVMAVLVSQVDDTSRFLYRGGFLVTALAVAAVIAAAVQPHDAGVRRWMRVEPLRRLGLVSYGVYLFHWPICLWLTPDRTGLDGLALLALRAAVTLAAAIASYRLVEMPIREARVPKRAIRVLAPAMVTAVSVGMVAVTAGGAAVVSASGSSVIGSSAPRQPTPPPSIPSPPGEVGTEPAVPLRAYLVGDSQAFTLGYLNEPPVLAMGVQYSGWAVLGCGLVEGDSRIGSRWIPEEPECTEWPQAVAEGVVTSQPDVAIVLVGAWEVLDRRIDGEVLRVGTPEYEAYLLDRLETVRRALTSTGARLLLSNVPCFDLSAGSPSAAEGLRNDRSRVDWLNGIWTRFAADHPDSVDLVDLYGFLCPGGDAVEEIDGIRIRSDGLHFTPEGALVVWRWLLPQIERAAM